MEMDNTEIKTSDAALIHTLGGPARVAALLKYDKTSGGVQRVQNWLVRGIPSAVKVKFPEIFLNSARPTASRTRATNKAEPAQPA